MQNLSLQLLLIGCTTVSGFWPQVEHTNIQRIYYITKGSGCYFDPDGTSHPFTAGTLYVFPYNFISNFYSNPHDPFEHLFLEFISSPPLISEDPVIHPVTPGSSLEKLLAYIVSFLKAGNFSPRERSGITGNSEPRLEQRIMFECLQLLLLQIEAEHPLPFAADHDISDVLRYIHEHFGENLRVEALAEHYGYTTEHFIRRFRKIMKITPGAYIQTFRLLTADQLIQGGMSVTEAALRCGYNNASSLSRALSKHRNRYK